LAVGEKPSDADGFTVRRCEEGFVYSVVEETVNEIVWGACKIHDGKKEKYQKSSFNKPSKVPYGFSATKFFLSQPSPKRPKIHPETYVLLKIKRQF
jgi:hypothetical protein